MCLCTFFFTSFDALNPNASMHFMQPLYNPIIHWLNTYVFYIISIIIIIIIIFIYIALFKIEVLSTLHII